MFCVNVKLAFFVTVDVFGYWLTCLTPSCLQRGTGRDGDPRSRGKEGGKGGLGGGGEAKLNATASPQ